VKSSRGKSITMEYVGNLDDFWCECFSDFQLPDQQPNSHPNTSTILDASTEKSSQQENRRQLRLLQNRRSAKLSRERKKENTDELKAEIKGQEARINLLMIQNRHLTLHNQKLVSDNRILYQKCCESDVHINVDEFRLCTVPAESVHRDKETAKIK
jgi:hypothetical protein